MLFISCLLPITIGQASAFQCRTRYNKRIHYYLLMMFLKASPFVFGMMFLMIFVQVAPAEQPASALRYCLEKDSIPDHGDRNRKNSLAWQISNTKAPSGSKVEIILPGPRHYSFTTSFTIPKNISLMIEQGALLDLDDHVTVIINGSIFAGSYRIFSGKGKIAGHINDTVIKPKWWGNDGYALEQALGVKGKIDLGRDTFTIQKDVEIQSDTYLTGSAGAMIVSLLSGNPHNYYGILKTSDKTEIKNVTIKGIKFKNTKAIGLYALAINQGGGNAVKFINCEAEGCGLMFGINVKNVEISNCYCYSSTLDGENLFDDHHHGICITGNIQNCIIKNNRIYGRRCHGISLVSQDIYSEPTKNPEREMLGKHILVEGNTVIPGSPGRTAGGIWFSSVQDCKVIKNRVEDYGDVGIDFEGSRDCVADSNLLKNNNKNLAVYGNCRNITFSHNTVRMTKEGKDFSAAFFNTYSNGYPGITDLRNSDIFVFGNIFTVATQANPKGWTGGIIAGTAKKIVFKNNTFTNCHFESHFCCDLETIEISDNYFLNDLDGEKNIPVFLAVAELNKKTKQAAKNYIITNNIFALNNDSNIPCVIQIATNAVIHGIPTLPYCDLNIIIENNNIRRSTPSKPAIIINDNYQTGYYREMKVSCTVKNNISNGEFKFEIPHGARQKKFDLMVENNKTM